MLPGSPSCARALAPDARDVRCPHGVTVGEALGWATRLLAAGGVEVDGHPTPRLDAELLLGVLVLQSRAELYVHERDCLDDQVVCRYTRFVRRRLAHEPVAYILGRRSFYDVELYVNRYVLIPRPETEHLVEEALAWGRAHQSVRAGVPLGVVDVGTGSGALAIVLARHLPRARLWAVDLSREALDVAAANLRRYGLQHRVLLVCGDLLAALRGPFSLIVANLPYVAHDELGALQPDVSSYEPCLALDGGPEGLKLIRRLLAELPERLAVPGLALLEIDPRQAVAVVQATRDLLPTAAITLLRDYAGLDRLVRIEQE